VVIRCYGKLKALVCQLSLRSSHCSTTVYILSTLYCHSLTKLLTMQQQTTNKSDADVDEGYLESSNMLKEEEPSSPIATAAMTATLSTKKKTAAVQWQKKKRTTAAAAAAEEEDDGLEDSSSSLLPIVEDANEGKAAGIGEVVMPRQAALAAAEKVRRGLCKKIDRV